MGKSFSLGSNTKWYKPNPKIRIQTQKRRKYKIPNEIKDMKIIDSQWGLWDTKDLYLHLPIDPSHFSTIKLNKKLQLIPQMGKS